MPAGATAEILISVPAPPNTFLAGSGKTVSVTAEATVRGEAPDPVKLSNSDTATTPVDPPAAAVELQTAAEPQRVALSKLTGVAVVRLGALVRNLGPVSLRAGETSLVFRSFNPVPGVRLVRTFGEVRCDEDDDPAHFAVGCEVGALGVGDAGFNVSISVSFSSPGRYVMEVMASGAIAGSIFNERIARKLVDVEVLPAPD